MPCSFMGKPTWTYQQRGTLHDSHIAIFMGTMRLFKIIWGPTGAPYVQTMSYEALQVDDVFRKQCILTPVNQQKTSKNDGVAFWSVVKRHCLALYEVNRSIHPKISRLVLLVWDLGHWRSPPNGRSGSIAGPSVSILLKMNPQEYLRVTSKCP